MSTTIMDFRVREEMAGAVLEVAALVLLSRRQIHEGYTARFDERVRFPL
jgi:hypothetical protein